MKYSEVVSYRAECEAPSAPGWYWAQEKGNKRKPPRKEIIPMPVVTSQYTGKLIMATSIYPIDNYRWFGPVIMVTEG